MTLLPGEGEPRKDGIDPQLSQLREVAASFRQTFKTAEQLASSFLRLAITRGVYRPGAHLQQDEIASVLGISRIPVRAALVLLESEGLLTTSPHRGAIVTALDPEQIREIYELRAVLECYLVDQVFPRLTPAYLAELRASVAKLEDAPTAGDIVELRMSFYEKLYSLAQCPRALKLVSRLHGEVDRYLLALRVVEDPGGHFVFLDYLERRDLKGAKRWLRAHLEEVSGRLQAVILHSDPDYPPRSSS